MYTNFSKKTKLVHKAHIYQILTVQQFLVAA